MEQASVLVLLLCAVGISAHALPAYDTVQELSEYPWHETEKEESVIDINKEKRYSYIQKLSSLYSMQAEFLHSRSSAGANFFLSD